MKWLPRFSFNDYRLLLQSLQTAGYRFGLIAEKDTTQPRIYLRHDVDFFLSDWMQLPEIEAQAGARATYYVLVGHYNLDTPEAKTTLSALVDLEHEIGFHYDTRRYPADPLAAQSRMTEEIAVLEGITDMPVRTITRHNVFLKAHEPARLGGLIDPFDADYLVDTTYISDSVRSWRDETLLSCFGSDRPDQVVLLTHPESWLDGRIENRVDYLERIVFPRLDGQDELKDELMNIWTTHEAAILHDNREFGIAAK
jgi:hypothetical protein